MGASAGALVLSVPLRERCTRLLRRRGLHQKAAIGAVGMMEETMRVLTIAELMHLTRIELFDLVNRITNELPTFPEGSPERANALITLRNIRYILARRDFSP
jgi:hypothetical protein